MTKSELLSMIGMQVTGIKERNGALVIQFNQFQDLTLSDELLEDSRKIAAEIRENNREIRYSQYLTLKAEFEEESDE